MMSNIAKQEANTLDKYHKSKIHQKLKFVIVASHGIYVMQKKGMYLSSIQEILYKSPRQVSYSIGGLGYSPGQ